MESAMGTNALGGIRRRMPSKRGYDMDYIEDYLTHLERRNRAPTTIEHYRFVIGRCLGILADNGMSAVPEEIGEESIALLMSVLEMSENTMKNTMNIIGRFCEYCTGRNPVKRMDILWNRNAVTRKFIDKDEFNRLLDNADPSERMVLMLGAYMGLRRKEIGAIRLGDIGINRIRVSGKGHGRKGLVVQQPMPELVRNEIERYLAWRLQYAEDGEDHLIIMVSEHGAIPMHRHLPAMSNRISRLGRRLDIEVSCHSLRRLYCSTLAECGCPLETIKHLMRHSDINTTLECYIRPSDLRADEWTEICCEELSEHINEDSDDYTGFGWLDKVPVMVTPEDGGDGKFPENNKEEIEGGGCPEVIKSEDSNHVTSHMALTVAFSSITASFERI